MFNDILLAVDGSEYSLRALECARSLAEHYKASLWLVHVFSHTSDLLGYQDFEKLYAKRKSAGQAILVTNPAKRTDSGPVQWSTVGRCYNAREDSPPQSVRMPDSVDTSLARSSALSSLEMPKNRCRNPAKAIA